MELKGQFTGLSGRCANYKVTSGQPVLALIKRWEKNPKLIYEMLCRLQPAQVPFLKSCAKHNLETYPLWGCVHQNLKPVIHSNYDRMCFDVSIKLCMFSAGAKIY